MNFYITRALEFDDARSIEKIHYYYVHLFYPLIHL